MKHIEKPDPSNVARALILLLPSIRNLIRDGMKVGNSCLSKSHLSKSHLMVLMTLSFDGARTMTGLHEIIGIEKGSLTPVADALVKKGYVTRTADINDRRKILLSLTPSGNALAEECKAELSSRVERKVSILSKEDLFEMMSALAALKTILDKVNLNNLEKSNSL